MGRDRLQPRLDDLLVGHLVVTRESFRIAVKCTERALCYKETGPLRRGRKRELWSRSLPRGHDGRMFVPRLRWRLHRDRAVRADRWSRMVGHDNPPIIVYSGAPGMRKRSRSSSFSTGDAMVSTGSGLLAVALSRLSRGARYLHTGVL
jgi:hypothetical protein